MRVSIFGTHPSQMNGYSKVMYELMQVLAIKEELKLSIFGFQNLYTNKNHRKEYPDNVYIHDAVENESPKASGFGFEQVNSFLMAQRPDVVIIYNDCIVISKIIEQIEKLDHKKFKTVMYVDQVYPYMQKCYIDMINKHADAVILFTKYWETCIKDQGVIVPTFVMEHGINKNTYFHIPSDVARKYFGIKEDDYIVLNLNRNQPRKRWDICLKAWAEIVKKFKDEPIKLLIGTNVQGGWNLLEIYERELKKRGLTLEIGMKHVILIDNPQSLSDIDINILYNVVDLGLTTCDGEGWGLCSFEHMAIGVPQIAPRLGGFIEFLNDDNATLIDPSWAYYVDTTRDNVGGEASVCNYTDFAEAIELHYTKKTKRNHVFGKDIVTKYSWDIIAQKFMDIMKEVNPESLQLENIASIDPEKIPDEICVESDNKYVTKEEFNSLNTKLDSLINMIKIK